MAELDARRAYLLSNSATIIQKQIKTHFTRKTYIALQKSSIFMQSICRGQLFAVFVLCEVRKAYSLCLDMIDTMMI